MMTIITRIILSLLILSPLYANKHDETYHRANKLLKSGQYQDALDDYQTLNFQGPVTYYNTAIALYHLQQYGKALAMWEKAEKHASPGLVKKIVYNKHKAYKKLEQDALEDWRSFFVIMQSYFSLFLLQIVFLLVWFCWWFAEYTRIDFIKKYRVLLLLISLGCGLLLGLKYWVQECRYAFIVTPQAQLFAGPNIEFDVVAELKEGERVKVMQQEDAWYKIKYHKAHGWIQGANIE
ncbi:MAG: tetratricopeptide (TPR) repeat protein [Alteromonas naphthalenivorans]|jgi:tetratricopeptide (TPR) repeat protein